MMEISYIVPVFVIKLLTLIPWMASGTLEYHLHSDSGIESTFTTDDFDGSAACWAALYRLCEMGTDNVVICSVNRIEAPLSGYLVDATGELEIDGREYTVFRVGVRDGRENPDWAGVEFVFLAAGFDDSGAYIYPPGAGIENPDGNFTPEHEFLLDTEEFLSIPIRFRPEEHS